MVFESWKDFRRNKELLRSSLERKTLFIALAVGLLGIITVHWSITGFSYEDKNRLFILWSFLMGGTVSLFLVPLTYLVIDVYLITKIIHAFEKASRIEPIKMNRASRVL